MAQAYDPNVFTPVDADDPAKGFWDLFWGKSNVPLENFTVVRDGSLSTIEHPVALTCRVLPAHPLSTPKGKPSLYRDEYDVVMPFIEDFFTRRPGGLCTITGHPGIGKSAFLYFLLADCLAKSRPTVFQNHFAVRLLYFTVDGVYTVKRDLDPQSGLETHFPRRTWSLIDASANFTKPFSTVLHPDHFSTVLSASPRKSHWRYWRKTLYAQEFFIMKPWSFEELVQARTFQGILRSEKVLLEFYNTYGGSAREAYSCGRLANFEDMVKQDATRMTGPKIREVIGRSIYGGSIYDESYKALIMVPKEDDRSWFRYICTPHVYRILLNLDQAGFWGEAKHFYDLFLTKPNSEATAGYILEMQMHTFLPKAGSMELIEMIPPSRLASNAIYKEGSITIRDLELSQRETYIFDHVSNVISAGLQDNVYYRPRVSNYPMLDAFVWNSCTKEIIMFQATVGGKDHGVKSSELERIDDTFRKIGMMPKYVYVAVVPRTKLDSLEVTIPRDWHGQIKFYSYEAERLFDPSQLKNKRHLVS